MQKLKLPNVTLVCVETREHELARLAIQDCLRVADFGDALILTDNKGAFGADYYTDCAAYGMGEVKDLKKGETSQQAVRFHDVPDWPDKLGWSRSWWYDVPPLLRTSHTLNIQWDSWIWDAGMWREDFLKYDYIGAPWAHHPPTGPRVGNGGFSLVSTRLKRYVADRRAQFPCDSDVDDALLCIKYRPALEAAGFVWAPEKVAYDFSFEGCDGSKPTKHFGFHALYNFPKVLDRDRLFERMELVMRSPYIAKPDSYMMKAFTEINPDIVQEMVSSSR